MPRARVAMHSIQAILRLRHECGCSQREIARSCGLSSGTVNKLLRQARQAGLSWPLPPELDEAALQERVYGRPAGARPSARREALDFAAVHKELVRRKHLTLQLVWQEYREQHADGYGYSQYCELYREWKTRKAHVFVAVLGASSYFYAEAIWGEDLESWIGSHVRALEDFGGAGNDFVPDFVPGNQSGLCSLPRYVAEDSVGGARERER